MSLTWTNAFVNGPAHTMTEGRALVSDGTSVFLATGNWESTVPLGGQILRQDAPGTTWAVEFTGHFSTTPGAFNVISAMDKVTFPQTGDTFLVASDGWTVRTRDAATKTWVQSGYGSARSFGQHTDSVTGVDLVFAGLDGGKIYSGTLVNGTIKWNSTPELTDPNGYRPMSFAVLGQKLYLTLFEDIWVRNDGPNPTWSWLSHNPNPGNSTPVGLNGLRGLAKAPFGPGIWTANTGSTIAILDYVPRTDTWTTLYPFPAYGGIPAYNKIRAWMFNGVLTSFIGYQANNCGILTTVDGANFTENVMPAQYTVAVRDECQSPFDPNVIYACGHDCDGYSDQNGKGWCATGTGTV